MIEAPLKSGASFITAHYAAEHGRTLLTVPGNIDRPTSAGSNDLLRGAPFRCLRSKTSCMP